MSRYFKNLFIVLYFSVLFSVSFSPYGEQQFSHLANSFLSGRLDINQISTFSIDTALYGGNHYWPLSPFPSIFILPFVYIAGFFKTLFLHRYIHWVLVAGVFILVYKIARKLNFTDNESLLWAFGFNLGSVFIGVSLIPWSWYYAQVICVLLIFLAIYEFLSKKRYFVLGLIYSFILLTRQTAFLGILFILLDIFSGSETLKVKFHMIVLLATPIVAAAVLLLSYNYVRFNNPFEQGYKYQVINGGTERARDYGLLSIKHIPGNLYYFLIAPPEQVLEDGQSKVLKFPFITYNDWGVGILYTSIYAAALFFISIDKKIKKHLLITTLVVAIPIFMYYGVGFRQYGFRYSLDFFPYLFFLLMLNYRKTGISNKFKLAIVVSIFFNIYLFYSKVFI